MDIGFVIGIIAVAIIISFAFRAFGFHESNYIMTYILGVLLIAYPAKRYWYGDLASVLITSTLTARVKCETQRTESRGKRIQILYEYREKSAGSK